MLELETLPTDFSDLSDIVVFFWKPGLSTYIFIMKGEYLQHLRYFFFIIWYNYKTFYNCRIHFAGTHILFI
jgi:hypothetical protein